MKKLLLVSSMIACCAVALAGSGDVIHEKNDSEPVHDTFLRVLRGGRRRGLRPRGRQREHERGKL